MTTEDNIQQEIRLDELAQGLPTEAFTEIQLNLDKPVVHQVLVGRLKLENHLLPSIIYGMSALRLSKHP